VLLDACISGKWTVRSSFFIFPPFDVALVLSPSCSPIACCALPATPWSHGSSIGLPSYGRPCLLSCTPWWLAAPPPHLRPTALIRKRKNTLIRRSSHCWAGVGLQLISSWASPDPPWRALLDIFLSHNGIPDLSCSCSKVRGSDVRDLVYRLGAIQNRASHDPGFMGQWEEGASCDNFMHVATITKGPAQQHNKPMFAFLTCMLSW
jgi:hypothetical protein